MNIKRYFLLFAMALCLFTVTASGNNEMAYLQIGSQSDDPSALMKVFAYVNHYEASILDELTRQYEEIDQKVFLLFSDQIDAYNAMTPEIWETDELFYERQDTEYTRLGNAILVESERRISALDATYDQQKKQFEEYKEKALETLASSRTLPSSQISIQNKSYDRNSRIWSLSASCDDMWVSFENFPLAVDLTTIGNEKIIRKEIVQFEEAVNNKGLQANLGWHFIRDYAMDRFLLIVDFVSVTNPLTGSSFALNLKDPILMNSYVVSGETSDALIVEDATLWTKEGIGNLSYQDRSGDSHTLNSLKKGSSLSWGVLKQTPKPAAPAPKPAAVAPGEKPKVPSLFASVLNGPQVFRISNGAEPESLDPAFIQGVPEHRIFTSLFEGLVAIDPITALAVPGVAESWTISADMRRYTFKLRKDALWSDGKPITAHDVVYSWLRVLDPETVAPYAWFPCMFIAGAQEFNDGRAQAKAVGIRALDDHTFQMDLIGPLPYTLDALTHFSFAIVPKHVIEKYGSAWTDPANFVGNGPFLLSERVAQISITVKKSKTYWDKVNVHLDKVIFYSSDSDTTNYNMYLKGELDWVTNVPLDQLKAAQMRSDFQKAPQLATYYYVFQNEKTPINNVLIRKALALAIDRTALVEGVTKAGEIPAWGIVPPMAGYKALSFPFADQGKAIAEARKLLSKAGYPNGVGFPTVRILYNTNEAHRQIAEFIQSEWDKNLGIKARLENQEWQIYLANRNLGNFIVARAGWVGDYTDPNTFLDMFLTDGGMNGGKYSNDVYDLLINESARMGAGSERMKVLRIAEDIMINKDQALMPLFYDVTMNMVDTTKWGGWFTNTRDYHPIKDIYRR